MFQTCLLSIIWTLVLYTQQYVFIIQVEIYTKINLRNNASRWFVF